MSTRYSVILIARDHHGIGGPGPESARQLASGSNLAPVLERAIRELKVLLVNLRAEGEKSQQTGG